MTVLNRLASSLGGRTDLPNQALARIAAARPEYNRAIFPYLLHHLETCRPKDLPQRPEKILQAVTHENRAAFRALIEKRLEIATPAEAKRLQRILRELEGR